MGEGAIQGNLSKQKLNTCSSCDIELVGNDDASTKILWTQLFMEAQGYKVQQNIMYQDNKSTIQLLKMGVAVLTSDPTQSILVIFSWQTNTTKDSSTSSTVLQVRCGRVQWQSHSKVWLSNSMRTDSWDADAIEYYNTVLSIYDNRGMLENVFLHKTRLEEFYSWIPVSYTHLTLPTKA